MVSVALWRKSLRRSRGGPPVLRLGVEDAFPKVGAYEYVLEQCGLTDGLVASRVITWLKAEDSN